ncbi:hypothetical protein EC957_002017 [Mortierella hygrophila]|uniref:HCP-like protein n=1 Tax=Mortierella hygrophila TaxID=979708 RepID=A0A9P6FFT0_9FUNG|nr:hypothetical protein EC957_002017 [Mortierella hygrophila]
MSFTPPNTQGIRSININNPTSSPPHPTEVLHVDIYTDRITKKKVILWEDVRLVFHNALHVRHKTRVVPFMKDDDFNTIKPLRIAVIPGEILDIFVGNPQQDNTPQQPPSDLRQIEQQAAGLPRHNPFSTMRPISPTHPSTSVLNPRFRPPGNNFPSRQQFGKAAARARNKELTRKYAKEAMTKIADTVDLDALHTKGDAGPADFWKAPECYLKAVHQSHAHAQVQVGDLFIEGQHVSKDSSVAVEWYHRAALQGDTNALLKVEALRLSEHQNTASPDTRTSSLPKAQHNSSKTSVPQASSDDNEPQMSKEIPPLANKASALADNSLPTKHVVSQRDIVAQVALGNKYVDNQDYQAAMECYLKAANQGCIEAQFNVGVLYDEGNGVPQDFAKAMEWYRMAADQGDARAQCNIGAMYREGSGVPQDFSKAMEWFRLAADQGHTYTQFNIGFMYEEGKGVPQDIAKAMEWFRMAADQGLSVARCNIGSMYYEGSGVPQDFTKAMEWYRMAADQGDARAQHNIGFIYREGKGVPQDFAKAMEWFRMAADQGNAGAQFNIGIMYDKGKGVPRDFAKAMEWYQKAAEQGDLDAKERLEELMQEDVGS